MKEKWIKIKILPNIEVSNFGRVRRPRIKKGGYIVYGQITCSPLPYKRVFITVGGKRRSFMVNRLVCEAFNGPPPSKRYQAAHKNGKHDDNRPDNLYWATPKQNCRDKISHGTHLFGQKINTNKLKEWQVLEIKHKLKIGEPVASLAKEYGVVWQSIANIRDGITWNYLNKERI